jgi:broad specificity phosphatase PhoE
LNKTLVLVRHAHRDTSDRDQDNGLSDKGFEQSEKILEYFKERFTKTDPILLSSKKCRCVETLEPISKKIKTPIKISPLLMEQEGTETEKEFRKRVETFCNNWKEGKSELTIVCSHGDWIPLALHYLVDVYTDLKKGGWAEIALVDGKPTLKYLIQKFI